MEQTNQEQTAKSEKMEERRYKESTKVVLNNLEMSYAEDLNSPDSFEPKPEYIFFVEDFRRKARKKLNEAVIPEIKKEITFWINKHPSTKIIHIFQFKKGTIKTEKQMEIALECQNVDGSKGICFYEQNPKQKYQQLETQLNTFIEKIKGKDKYVVLEIEAEEVSEKVGIALSKGIKNFIFIGGAYDNSDLWINKVINKIHKERGEVAILFPARMHTTTRESYFKKGIQFGADFVFHGKRGGGEVKKILYLDEQDLIYKEIEEIDDEALKEKLKNLPTTYEKYKLSRIFAINKANLFAKTYAKSIVIETK